MALLSDAKRIRALLKEFQSRKIAVPCFCSENTYTMEGILAGARRVSQSLGLETVAVFIAVTANYPGRQQLKNYTSLGSTEEGFIAFRSDLERLARSDGPFANVVVIPSLDHGQCDEDEFLFEEGKDFWGCVMYDCSGLSLDENRKRTAEFVKKHKDDYIIEGCVDEIVESGETDKMQLTDPKQAKVFLEQTGVDLMVVNLGTEHRATRSELKYRGDLARQISSSVGNKLVLHGASSLTENDLPKLADDGICKVNIWAVLETEAARSMAQAHIRNIGRMLSEEQIQAFFEDGWLGEKTVQHSRQHGPALDYLTEVYRRNELKVPIVSRLVEQYFLALGYEILALHGK
jgi:fructose/tagatose bisphosphate aldolase